MKFFSIPVAFLIIILIVFVAIGNKNGFISPPTSNSISQPSLDGIAYLINNDVYVGNEKFTHTNHVISLAYDKNRGIAYYAEQKFIQEPGYIDQTPTHTFFINEVNTKEKSISTILEVMLLPDSNTWPGVHLSADRELLSISTDTGLIIYNTKTKQKKTVSGPFYGALFSPNKSQILTSRRQYEGLASALIRLSNNAVKNLPYSRYGAGESALGWIDETHMLVIKSNGADQKPQAKTDVYKVQVDTLKEELIASVPYNLGSLAFIENNRAYFLSTTGEYAGKVSSYDGSPLPSFFDYLITVDLSTGEYQELFTTKDKDGFDEIHFIHISHQSDSKRIIINANKGQYTKDIYMYDLEKKQLMRAMENAVIY